MPNHPGRSRILTQGQRQGQRRPRSRWGSDDAFILGAAAAILVLSAVMTIENHERVAVAGWILPESCALKRMTGLPCPGCGLTRGFISLAHGDWSGSLRFHRLGWLMFGFAVLQIPYRTLRLADRIEPRTRWSTRILGVFIALLTMNWFITLAQHYQNILGNGPWTLRPPE